MLDTQEHKETSDAPASRNENGLHLSDSPESVEALEEALATARLRLQERLAGEVETQRRDLEKLKAEYEQRHTETNAMVAQANETAARVLRDANESSEQVRHEASDAAERIRHEATEASERMLREASEAAERQRHEAAEASERMLREANENARATLSQAQETANALLTRLRDEAGSFVAVAAAEVERVEKALAGSRPAAKSGKPATPSAATNPKAAAASQNDREKPASTPEARKAEATPEGEQTSTAEKEGPSRWIRPALKSRAGAPSGAAEDEAASLVDASTVVDEAIQPATGATEPAIEAVVTRMVVHPLVGATTRTRIKDRFEALPGIQAIKAGQTSDESFELLVIHPRESKILDDMLALAPNEILLREQKVGYFEVELKDLGWVDAEPQS